MDFWIPGFPFRFMIQSRGQIIVKWKGRGVGLRKKEILEAVKCKDLISTLLKYGARRAGK